VCVCVCVCVHPCVSECAHTWVEYVDAEILRSLADLFDRICCHNLTAEAMFPIAVVVIVSDGNGDVVVVMVLVLVSGSSSGGGSRTSK
jgi:hypothetical protein